MAVRDSWIRIEAWLTEHARYVLESLNPGAKAADVQAAGAELGVERLPEDFVQSWQIHDGQNWKDRPQLIAGKSGSYALMPLRWVVEHWQTWSELASSGVFDDVRGKARGPVRPVWWNRKWLPLAVNGVGDLVCLDLDPPRRGKLGQVIEVLHEEEDRTVLAASFGAWLDGFATDLEMKKYVPTHEQFHGLVFVRDL
jgi:cell wall assembly regulator SMI1